MNILIHKAKKQDKEAYTQLMLSVGSGLYKVAWGILGNDEDVADAMQETALLGWEKIHTLRQMAYFKTWITRILINVCNEMLRKKRHLVTEESIPEQGAEDRQYADVEWRQLLQELDEESRLLVLLYYAEGFKTREIAQILEMNENTVRGHLKRARDKMRKLYEGKEAREIAGKETEHENMG